MNSSSLSTKVSPPAERHPGKWRAKAGVFRRKLSAYRPFLSWGVVVVLAIALFFFVTRFVLPLAASLTGLVGKPLAALSILRDPAKALKSSQGRTNILMLGKGGSSHEAPDLTDSIMVVSIRHRDRKVSVISIPRDIWIDSMKAKINSAYYYGEQKQQGGGFILARDAVFQVTNLPIQYTVLVDFNGFKHAIDLVGGVDVTVEHSFTDEKYPIEDTNGQKPTPKPGKTLPDNQIYETVHFEQGLQHMDGDVALKFSRSRNSADPEEGTDFARGKRQQKVLIALAQKIKQKETSLNIDRLKELRNIFDQYTDTDIADQELLALGRVGIGINPSTVQHVGIDSGTKENSGILVNPPTSKYGQWVLESRMKDWSDVHAYIEEQLR